MSLVKTIVKQGISIAANSATVSRVARLIVANDFRARDTYSYLKAKFIANGKHHAIDEGTRREIVSRFERIDGEIAIASTPTDGLFLAEMLLNITAAGPIMNVVVIKVEARQNSLLSPNCWIGMSLFAIASKGFPR